MKSHLPLIQYFLLKIFDGWCDFFVQFQPYY
nr:MAG TPA: hypothetical protein [Caudoviricetes sp.]